MRSYGVFDLVDQTLDSAAADVAWDEILLREVETGVRDRPVLRLWEPPRRAVVLGRANRVAANVDVAACRDSGVDVVRRFSGGGTVLVGPGSLCFTLVVPLDPAEPRDIAALTHDLLTPLISGLTDATGEKVELRGTSDLVIGECKFSGNAQRWLRRAVLHHGTLAYALDVDAVERLLTPPERQPEYRRGRSHREFVTNLPLGRDRLRRVVVDAYRGVASPTTVPADEIARAVADRYGRDDWTYSR
ncbi:MAG: lipoate--protein ligase family protein [Planctomycetota bacterium]